MKILLISNMYPSDDHSYYGIFVRNFEEALIQDGIKVQTVAIKGRGKNKLEKIKKYIKFFTTSIKFMIKNDYDLIYVHYAKQPLLPFIFLQNYITKPYVINVHGDDIIGKSFLTNLLSRIIMRSDMLVVPSEYFRKIAYNKYKHKNIFISPSGGIDTQLFYSRNKTNKDKFTIGYISRVDEGKGWLTLLNAIHLLKTKNINIKLIIIGGGQQVKLLYKKIDELRLNKTVEYLGVKNHHELPYYFNTFNIFIFPTELNESLGLVGLEAMSCGVPVIGSRIGALPTYIKDGYNGILFETSNSSDLAKKIIFFLSLNETEMSIYEKNARETAKMYDSKTINYKLLKKLNKLLKD